MSVLYPTQEVSPDPGAYHECIGLEGSETTLENLGDMLEQTPDDASSFGLETGEEVG